MPRVFAKLGSEVKSFVDFHTQAMMSLFYGDQVSLSPCRGSLLGFFIA